MLNLHRPSTETIQRFLAEQRDEPFSYPEVGATRGPLPGGYDIDSNSAVLGRGEATFLRAVSAVRSWKMFDLGWLDLCWPDAPMQPGTAVAVVVRVAGVWFLNAARIAYLVDDEQGHVRRFGFAYGTLPQHAESGEERFLITWDRLRDEVSYSLLAFSRPRHPLARLGYPLARRL